MEVEPELVDAALREALHAAQRDWPAFQVPSTVFVAYLRDRIPAGVPPLLALRQMHASDLYLACACVHGEPRALAAFEERCLYPVARALGKMGIDADMIAEVKQEVRTRVLVGDGDGPQIAQFSGRGDLRGWVRIMAVRRALRRVGRARREVSMEDDELAQRLVVPGDSALDQTKARYREVFKRAFEAALRALPDRERLVLRQHYIDGSTIDDLAALYRIHRSTAARLIDRARAAVLDATRAQVMSQLDVRSQDLDSIVHMIRSHIDISLRGLRDLRG